MGSLNDRLDNSPEAGSKNPIVSFGKAPAGSGGAYKWVVIRSDHFPGEDILCIMDVKWLEEAKAVNPGMVVYTFPEIEVLHTRRSDAELLKAVHLIKKKFGGWVRSDA